MEAEEDGGGQSDNDESEAEETEQHKPSALFEKKAAEYKLTFVASFMTALVKITFITEAHKNGFTDVERLSRAPAQPTETLQLLLDQVKAPGHV